MRVRLMLTCLCDAFHGEVGVATVRILEHLGCEVLFPENQTCCGQPPYNAGDREERRLVREIALRTCQIFDGVEPVIVPSSSCAAMVTHGYRDLGLPPLPARELSQFIVHDLGVSEWTRRSAPIRVGYHRACHGRGIGLRDEQVNLLSNAGYEVVELAQPEQCCGFGGAFSINHPFVSAGIAREKLRTVAEAKVDLLASGDVGCLMHLQGIADREGIRLRTRHWAQLLAETLP